MRNALDEPSQRQVETVAAHMDLAGKQIPGIADNHDYTLLTRSDHKRIELLEVDADWEPLETPHEGDIIKLSLGCMTQDAEMRVLVEKGTAGIINRINSDGFFDVFFPSLLSGRYVGFPKWFAIRRFDGEDSDYLLRRSFPEGCEALVGDPGKLQFAFCWNSYRKSVTSGKNCGFGV